jgi:large subunit ribosomal protein L22
MAQAKAKLNTHRQSPRKVRLVADLVRGKQVDDALNILTFASKRASLPVRKLISSAIANAKDLSIPTENLVVKEISVDDGKTLYRRRPMSRGRAFVIRKRTSHVSVTLEEMAPKAKKAKKTKAKTA